MNWPALAAARRQDTAARLPFLVGDCTVGSVARVHLDALRDWPTWLLVSPQACVLTAEHADEALAAINGTLHQRGLLRAWRDERCALVDPSSGRRLAAIERAAARFWGTLTLGSHANGYLTGPDGRPSHLWIARRADDKATDPGLHDNLVGGGVPDGQTPFEALVREGWEEAGLDAELMRQASAGRVLRLQRDIPEGLQVEDLHVHDLALPPGLQPRNQDGEVQSFQCLPMAEALALAAGSAMTVDASLATLDFALRHGLLAPPAGADTLFG